jgi:anti-sigma factor RsiW
VPTEDHWEDAVAHEDAAPGNDCRAGDRRLDAAGWVLDSLDPDDAKCFAQHLLTCPECRQTVAGLEPAARALLMRASLRVPVRLQAATLGRVRSTDSRARQFPGD